VLLFVVVLIFFSWLGRVGVVFGLCSGLEFWLVVVVLRWIGCVGLV